MLAFLATTTVYTTNSTNNFVYLTAPSTAAAAAGYILLSIINIIWMFYFGTTDETKFHIILDSFTDSSSGRRAATYTTPAQQLDPISSRANPFTNRDSALPSTMRQRASLQPGTSNFAGTDPNYQHMFMAAPLGGFENSSDVHSKDINFRQSHGSMGDGLSASDVPATPTVYPYRARAIYACMII